MLVTKIREQRLR